MKGHAIVARVRGVVGRIRGGRQAAPAPRDRTVLVVAASGDLPRRWADRLAGDRVSVVRDADALPAAVRRLPPLDLVVCLLDAEGPDPVAAVVRTYRAVRPRGRLVVEVAEDSADARARIGRLTTWSRRLEARARRGGARARDEARSLEVAEADEDRVALVKRGRHLLALRESEVVETLPLREPGLTVSVVEEHPAGELVSSSVVFSHGEHEAEFPTRFAYPPLALRHYEGPIVSRGWTLAYAGNTALPDSFRFHLATQQRHPLLDPVGDDWHRVRGGRRPGPLAGSYYLLESTFPHHYGHVMAEVVSRLWGWDAAKRADPELKVMLHVRPKNPPADPLERRVFEAYGIAPEDIVVLDRPVVVDSLWSATPMWHQHRPFYVHPGMLDTYERLAHGFTDGDPDGAPAHERIFVSRGEGAVNRRCLNQPDVEAWFADRGFEIVYPERHTLAEQVHLFRKAREVAGFGGSGMFNIVYARNLEKLVVLNHEAYIARNEHMFCSLLGAEEHYLWSTPEVVHPEGRFSVETFRADWRFDFARNEAHLRKVVGG